jgi:hypothetical protein
VWSREISPRRSHSDTNVNEEHPRRESFAWFAVRKWRVLLLALGGLTLVAFVAVAWAHRQAATADARSGVWPPPFHAAGDPMPIMRPKQGLDTAMPIVDFDTAAHARLPTSPQSRHR